MEQIKKIKYILWVIIVINITIILAISKTELPTYNIFTNDYSVEEISLPSAVKTFGEKNLSIISNRINDNDMVEVYKIFSDVTVLKDNNQNYSYFSYADNLYHLKCNFVNSSYLDADSSTRAITNKNELIKANAESEQFAIFYLMGVLLLVFTLSFTIMIIIVIYCKDSKGAGNQ